MNEQSWSWSRPPRMSHGPRKSRPCRVGFFVPPCLPLDNRAPHSCPKAGSPTSAHPNILGVFHHEDYSLSTPTQEESTTCGHSHKRENATTRERQNATSRFLSATPIAHPQYRHSASLPDCAEHSRHVALSLERENAISLRRDDAKSLERHGNSVTSTQHCIASKPREGENAR